MTNGLPIEQSLSQRVIRNTIYNIVGRLWTILVALFLTPYIIHHIGLERFGIWAVMGVMTGYFGLFDFGIGTAFVKYIAEFYAKKDYVRIKQIINVGFVFYFIFAIPTVALSYFFIDQLLYFFKIPPYLYTEAKAVFLLGIALFSISNILSPFAALQGGLQRMDVTNKLAIFISIPNIAGTFFFLEKGYGLLGLVVNGAVIFLISSIFNVIVGFRILPELKFNPFSFSREAFGKLFSFGYKLQIARISSMVSMHLEKLIISYFLSLSTVSFYQLGSSIIEKISSLSLLLPSVLIPAFSEMNAKDKKEKVVEIYIRAMKYQVLTVAPLFVFVIISAPQIMMVWMGPGYEKCARIIQILGVGWLLPILAGIVSSLVQGIGKTAIEMRAGLIASILTPLLSILFIIQFGFMGAAIGTSLALIVTAVYFFRELHREIGLPLTYFIRGSTLKIIFLCVCIGCPLWILSMLQGNLFYSSRIFSFAILSIQALLFFGIYIMGLRYIKPLDLIDISRFQANLPILQRLVANFAK